MWWCLVTQGSITRRCWSEEDVVSVVAVLSAPERVGIGRRAAATLGGEQQKHAVATWF